MSASSHPRINWLDKYPELKGHVKNQGNRVICWALAVAWVVGARHGVRRRLRRRLIRRWLPSAQFLIDDFIRDHAFDVGKVRDAWNNYPLNAEYALSYIRDRGIPYEEDYIYTGFRPKEAEDEEKRDTSKAMVDVALEVGADAVSHGCTGKGNDQGDILEEPANEPKKDMYMLSADPEDAPNQPEYTEIGIVSGIPVSLNGEERSPASLLSKLNDIGGKHGIGRIDAAGYIKLYGLPMKVRAMLEKGL